MNIVRVVLALGFSLGCCERLVAGTVTLPSDVSVALTAEPNINLNSGQRITLAMSVTNHGPQPVDRLILGSSPIYDELDVFTASADCDYNIALAVVDLEDTFYFVYDWVPASVESPLAVGETRYCYLYLDFTPWAPLVFPVTFGFPNWLFDLDPRNNSATVFLRRPVAVVEPVPTLSPTCGGMFACLLTVIVGIWRERLRIAEIRTQ
jgi:hypothetical protein